ncbi:MAG TPA: type II toxin-antitoxin system MqsA family antitoxin [Rhodanobacteraceae bacterium]
MESRYCLQCDDGTRLVHASRDVATQYKGREVVVKRVKGWHCPKCGEVEFDPGEGKRYSDALGKLVAESAADEAAMLRDTRKRLKLTQKAASRLTGGGHNAFSRYERGQARPVPAVINLFRLLGKHPELLEELR